MRVTFTSGAWVDMRPPQELTAKDKMKVQAATVLPSVDWSTGAMSSPMTMDMISRQTFACLDRIITAWSYDWVLPKDDISSDEDGNRTWDASLLQLGIDDWNELEEATEPHLEKMRAAPKARGATTSRSNGSSRVRTPTSLKASPRKS